jgi:hypothetical protein
MVVAVTWAPRGSPGAVEELVWNSLDADATEVHVELELNEVFSAT